LCHGDAGGCWFTLTNTYLYRITTTMLQVGIVNTGAITLSGVTRQASCESLFRIVETGDATFGATDSTFTRALEVNAETALTLSGSVTTSIETTLVDDSACTTADVLSNVAAGRLEGHRYNSRSTFMVLDANTKLYWDKVLEAVARFQSSK
jgi:hypothetical protein